MTSFTVRRTGRRGGSAESASQPRRPRTILARRVCARSSEGAARGRRCAAARGSRPPRRRRRRPPQTGCRRPAGYRRSRAADVVAPAGRRKAPPDRSSPRRRVAEPDVRRENSRGRDLRRAHRRRPPARRTPRRPHLSPSATRRGCSRLIGADVFEHARTSASSALPSVPGNAGPRSDTSPWRVDGNPETAWPPRETSTAGWARCATLKLGLNSLVGSLIAWAGVSRAVIRS